MSGNIANRSVPAATVIPELAYADVVEASDWLCNAFGFTVRLRKPTGTVCSSQPSTDRGALPRYERRAARFRRFSIAAARLARSAGVDRASTTACRLAHFDRSARVISRITS